uniref:N-acetylglucosaminylphosphatidylinositol deacetylase n=1 Tax=Globodera rostochiensis TaxID=31243 RepID=A0A914HDP6_GLORO
MQKAFKFFAAAIVISLLPIAIHFYGDKRITLPAKYGEHWLLLIAHPDDETMFFGPTLLFLSSIGVNVHFLLSELYSAAAVYGVHAKHVHFVDPEEQTFRDGFFDWNVTSLSASIYAHIKRTRPNGLITFDEWGISGTSEPHKLFQSYSQPESRRKARWARSEKDIGIEKRGERTIRNVLDKSTENLRGNAVAPITAFVLH